MNKYVIIGSSAAGINACTFLRKLDANSEILCITKDNFCPVNTCLLVDYLTKDIDIKLFPASYLDNNNIKLLLNSTVTKINRDIKTVIVNNSDEISYTHLILALGTTAKTIEQQDNNTFLFHNFTDAEKLKNYINIYTPKTAKVIGAGLNGLELASALYQLNIKVYLIKNKFILNKFIQSLNDTDKTNLNSWIINKLPITVTSNINTEANITISTIGSNVNTYLAYNSGLSINNGILVDENYQTSDPNIYAIGDCAEKENGIRTISWPGAIMQALQCSQYIINKKTIPTRSEIISSKFFNLELTSSGIISDDYLFSLSNTEASINSSSGYIRIIYKD